MIINKLRMSFSGMRHAIAVEYQETLELFSIGAKWAKGHQLTSDERSFLKHQSIDVIKLIGITGLFMVPMSGIMMLGMEAVARKKGMSIFPKRQTMKNNTNNYRIFLDDERRVEDVYENCEKFVTARSVSEFKKIIQEKGIPEFISFDHDLGEDENGNILPSGYDAAKWMVYEAELDIRNMSFKTHSSNIQTRDQINGLLGNWQKHLGKDLRSEVRAIIESSLMKESGVRVPFTMEVPADVLDIHDIFKKTGYQLVLVGGCVRDAVMGKKPKDFDLATDALPDDVETLLKDNGYKTLPVGKSFGIINVVTSNDTYEIATYRGDQFGDSSDGRRPDSVYFTDMEQDAKRRDLTINALYYDIGAREVIDMVGGLEDIKQGVIQTVGSAEDRFKEDRLRIMRSIRFAARTGHNVSPEIDASLRKDSSLNGISAERIRDEFLKGISSAKSVVHFLKMLDRYKMFPLIFPDAMVNKKFPEERDHAVLIAFLLAKNGIDKTRDVLKKMKYTGNEVKSISLLVGLCQLTIHNAVTLKKAQMSTDITGDQVIKFGGLIGESDQLFRSFAQFELTVKASDMDPNLRGAELGEAIYKAETEKFKAMLSL